MDPDAAPAWRPPDEGRHAAGDGPWWAERWWFGWWAEAAAGTAPATGGFVELTLFPNRSRAWYRAALVRPGEPLLAVVDHDAPVPRVGLELRTDGLWADHSVEAPFEQWTVANETFALAVDEPDELIGRAYGGLAPLAFDVEWYASGPPGAVPGGYAQAGEVEGVAELGHGRRLDVAGASLRTHTWGPLRVPDGEDPSGAEGAVVPDRWPAPFAVVVDDVLAPLGWRRRHRPGA